MGGSSLVTAGWNGGGSTKRYHIDIYDTIDSRTLDARPQSLIVTSIRN